MFRKRLIFLLVAILVITPFYSLAATDDEADAGATPSVEMYVMDVGHGDAILIASQGEYMMVDAGRYGEVKQIMEKLDAVGVETINVAVGSHWDGDHIGGFNQLLKNYRIDRFYYSSYFISNALTGNIKNNIEKEGCPHGVPNTGDTWTIGDAQVKVVSDGRDTQSISKKKTKEVMSNNSSIVLKVTCNGTSILLTGDATEDREKRLSKSAVNCDILKVSHHAVFGATTKSFINKTSPKHAVISTDSGLAKSPNVHVMYDLSYAGVMVHRTDKQGDIKYIIDADGNISYETEKNAKSVDDAVISGIKTSYNYKKAGVKPVPKLKVNGKTLYCKQNKKCRMTSGGQCFHYSKNCRSIKGSKTSYVTVAKAQSKGKRACGYCVKTPLDYKVTYKNYKARGTAAVTVTGLGRNVFGVKTIEYNIK